MFALEQFARINAVKLKKTDDLFRLSIGDTVTKRNLFDLIQLSKVKGSRYWSGTDSIIGNTPQQGINWIGSTSQVRAVIIKTRPGSYEHDGWIDQDTVYRYSFKATNGSISYTDTANRVLIDQPQQLYPILLFVDNRKSWRFEGTFGVSEISDRYVTLRSDRSEFVRPIKRGGLREFKEGQQRYVTHLVVERSKAAVKTIKSARRWICDICQMEFHVAYGVRYIEAHHKVPISISSGRYTVRLADFVLLCSNCHRAVHIHMRQHRLNYAGIKSILVRRLSADPPRSRYS